MIEKDQKNFNHGIWLMCGAMFTLPLLDCFAKLLGENEISSGQIVLFRFSFQSIVLFPILLWANQLSLTFKHFWLQLFRALAMATATFCFFIAVRYMPLADSIAIFFVEPIILTILSVLFLGEVVKLRRITAIIIGFIGAVIIIRPQFSDVGLIALLPLITAASFATYMLITRYFSEKISPVQMQFQMGLIIVPILSIFVLLFPNIDGFEMTSPNFYEWNLLIALGLVATGGHLLLVFAAGKAPANLLAPFQYVEIIGATFLGFFVFGDVPTIYTSIGITLIVLSGLYLWYRENQLQKDSEGAYI
jgi:S-adenosylmethionine uptake transporter